MMYAYPNEIGRYGEFGGKFVPETLMQPLAEIEQAFRELKEDPAFQAEYVSLLRNYSGRPTALTYADQLSAYLGGAKIYLKREDLNHTGAHKINNALGQALLAKKMGKSNIIAETGAGQHGSCCNGGRKVRVILHGIYGKRRCGKTITQCLSNETVGR